MDQIDRKICEIIQADGKASNAAIAETVGVSVSTANERLRRLGQSGVIKAWRAVLEPDRAGAGLCAFVLLDVAYEGESEAVAALKSRPEVMELHHVSGPHAYLAKIRVSGTGALQHFLCDVVKPLAGVQRTETIFSLDAVKETTEVLITAADGEA